MKQTTADHLWYSWVHSLLEAPKREFFKSISYHKHVVKKLTTWHSVGMSMFVVYFGFTQISGPDIAQ